METVNLNSQKKDSNYGRGLRKTDQTHGILFIEEADKERHRTVGISFSASLQPGILIVISSDSYHEPLSF